MTLYTSTVITPRARPRRWARFGSGIGYALGLPILLLVVWGIWSSFSSTPFFPSPLVIAEAFVDTWIGPAFVTDVLPSLGRLLVGTRHAEELVLPFRRRIRGDPCTVVP